MSTLTDLLTVNRTEYGKDYTRGSLLLRDNPRSTCFTVEDERRRNGVIVRGETCIPEGRYPLALRWSPKFSHHYYVRKHDPYCLEFGLVPLLSWQKLSALERAMYRPHDVIWITDVPGFRYILLHWGNTDDDTDGCLIVGSALGIVKEQPGVIASRVCYEAIYPLLAATIAAGDQHILYRDGRVTA